MPRWWIKLRVRLRSLLAHGRLDDELDEELRYHHERLSEEFVRRGLSPAEARRAARLEMDGLVSPREACRDARGTRGIGEFGRDMRLAARSLLRSKGFAASVISSLALGFALVATTTAVVDAYLIRPLPVEGSERLYHVWYSGQPNRVEPSGLRRLDWTRLADVVELADASTFTRYYLTESGYTQEVVGLQVAKEAIGALGITVQAGRPLTLDDFTSGIPPALISDRLWRERFDGNPSAIGQRIHFAAPSGVEAQSFHIAGILPRGFRYVRSYGWSEVDVAVPFRGTSTAYMVRLEPGVPLATAETRITEAVRTTPGMTLPAAWSGVRLESVNDAYVKTVRPILVSAWIAAGFVLAIVGANVAILVLLRNLRRQREAAVRVALGAGRWHLLRAVTAEALVLCAAAAGTGLLLTTWILAGVGSRIEATLGLVAPGGTHAIGLEWTSVTVIIVLAAAVVLGMSVVSATAVRRAASAGLMSGAIGARSATDGTLVRRARAGLLVLEVAGSIALIVGCGLMVRTAVSLAHADLGLVTAGVMRTRLVLPARTYDTAEGQVRAYERLIGEVERETGAIVGLANWPLLVEAARPQAVELGGNAGESAKTQAAVTAVTRGYFDGLQIPVLEGRGFESSDRTGSQPIALVSASFAARAWPDRSAVGRQLRTSDRSLLNDPLGPWRTVVGVVGDVRQVPHDDDLTDVYVPYFQVPSRYAVTLIRPRETEAAVVWQDRLRTLIGRIDPSVLGGTVTPLSDELARVTARQRFLASLLTGFAGFAAFITLLGVYGVTAHATRQREAEIAIRLALGSNRRQVVQLFLSEMFGLVAGGAALGVAAALLVGRGLESQLHDVGASDPLTIAVTTAGVGVCAVVSSWIPVQRATGLQPARLFRAP